MIACITACRKKIGVPFLQLGDSSLRVNSYVVGQHHQAQQLHVDGLGLHLLLRHVNQAQICCLGNHADCHGQQAKAFAAVLIHDLQIKGALVLAEGLM